MLYFGHDKELSVSDIPDEKQLKSLESTLEECRWLYNHLLDNRKTAYAQEGKSLTCYGQQATYPMLKAQRPSLSTVHSQVLQNVAVRVDLDMQAFFRRLKAGEKSGYPRFKSYGRYDSFTYPQSGFSVTHDHRVTLSKIGSVTMVYHRPVRGSMKTATVHRSSTGKWYVTFSCECDPQRLDHCPRTWALTWDSKPLPRSLVRKRLRTLVSSAKKRKR